jgi:hypothetical protein
MPVLTAMVGLGTIIMIANALFLVPYLIEELGESIGK